MSAEMAMNNFFIYLLKVNLILVVFYLVYRLLLHQSGLHQLNRYLIISIPIVAILIPGININLAGTSILSESLLIADFENFSGQGVPILTEGNTAKSNPIVSLLVLLYFVGFAVFLFRFILQLRQVIKIKGDSLNMREGKYTYVFTKKNHTFSFFYWVFLPVSFKTGIKNEIILEHEKIHANEWHSIDLIWLELIQLCFWYNPLVISLKKLLKETHEFIVDRKLIGRHVDLTTYLKTLFLVMENRLLPSLANPFNSKSIKNRIGMMNLGKVSLTRRLRYLILAPVLFLLIQSFAPEVSTGSIPSIMPVKGAAITLDFGFEGLNPVTHKHMNHKGLDLKAEPGTDIVATADGIVVKAKEEEGYGNLVVVKHTGEYLTYYAHLNDFSVTEGEKVVQGQLIGHVGNTGYSTGPHLHYEIRKEGIPVNPSEYFE